MDNLVPVKSRVDGLIYRVRDLPSKLDAADFLADINQRLIKLSRHMIAKYMDDKNVNQLFSNFDKEALKEGTPKHGNTSYVYKKGKEFVLCIRHKETGYFVDPNVVMFVAIHELSHVMTETYGHDSHFMSNFIFLLKEAIDIGVYKRVDFSKYPQDYCGIKITQPII
jgi:hypothetical protein